MKNAVLGIRRQIVGCACEKEISNEDIAQASLFEEPEVQRFAPEYHLAEIKSEGKTSARGKHPDKHSFEPHSIYIVSKPH